MSELFRELPPEIQREKDKELLRKITEHGGGYFTTMLPKKYSPCKFAGFNTVDNKTTELFRENFGCPDVRTEFARIVGSYNLRGNADEYRFTAYMRKLGIGETVAIKPVEKNIYEKQKVKKGWFRKEEKRIYKGKQRFKHFELVRGESEEQAYQFLYYSTGTYLPPIPGENRPACPMEMSIILPKSLAEEVLQRIKVDPRFSRQIVADTVIQKLKLDKQVWKNGDEDTDYKSIEPPFGQGKIYLYEDGKEYGKYDQTCVLPIKEGLIFE